MTVHLFPRLPMSEGAARDVLANPHPGQSSQLRRLAWATLATLRVQGNDRRCATAPADLPARAGRGSPLPPARLTGRPTTTHPPRPARHFFAGGVTTEPTQ